MLYLPQLAFSLTAPEQALLTLSWSPRRKNISYQPDTRTLRGVADKQKTAAIARLMARYHQMTLQLIDALLPGYGEALHHPQTSLRLHPITAGVKRPRRKDDSRLHVDAFPSRPVKGDRILRIFAIFIPRRTANGGQGAFRYPRGTLSAAAETRSPSGSAAGSTGDHQKSA